MAMTIRPESARSAPRMEISRSGHGTDGPGEGPCRPVPLTVRRSEHRRVRAPRPAPARGGRSPRCVAATPRSSPSNPPTSWWPRDATRSPPSTGSPRASGWVGAHSSSATRPNGCRHGARRSRRATVPDVVFARFDAHAVVAADGARHRARGGSGTGRAGARPARRSTPRRVRRPPRSRGQRPVADEPRPRRLRGAGRDRARAAARGRVLPGQPHPSAHLRPRARPGRALRRASPARTPRRTPRCCACPALGPGTAVVSASPERLPATRSGARSRPARSRAPPRDRAHAADQRQGPRRERDDRRPRPQRPRALCVPGSVQVPALCAIEAHPGLHHLVSTVTRSPARRHRHWARSLAATFPPASVTGAPEAAGAPGHRRPRTGATGRLLRRARVDRHDADRRPSRPSSRSPSAPSPCWATASTVAPTWGWAAASSPIRGPAPSGTRPS